MIFKIVGHFVKGALILILTHSFPPELGLKITLVFVPKVFLFFHKTAYSTYIAIFDGCGMYECRQNVKDEVNITVDLRYSKH